MSDFLAITLEMLMGRTTGPLTLRLVLQPSIAAFLAIRAGLADARAGRTPFLWAVATLSAKRSALLRDGWAQIRVGFFIALAVDVVYQIIVFRWVYPGQALLAALVLSTMPYLCIRGIVTRLAGRGDQGAT